MSIHLSSGFFQVFQPKWILYHELVMTTKKYMQQVIEIKWEWLMDIAPHYFKLKDVEDFGTHEMPQGLGKASLDLTKRC